MVCHEALNEYVISWYSMTNSYARPSSKVGLDISSVTRLCFHYLANYCNENVPQIIQIVPKEVENFARNQKSLNILQNIFKFFPKQ